MTAPSPDSALDLLMVDDHAIVREGLRRVLATSGSPWKITEAGTAFQALELLRQQHFDLAIVDLAMPGMSGLELIGRIRVSWPDLLILVLSMHAEEQYAIRAFKQGARGYVTKDAAAAELVVAVRKVVAGGVYVPASLAERVVMQLNGLASAPRHAELSNREFEVLQRIVSGQRLTDIANALHLSIKTVSTHKAHILEKLELPSMAALIRYGLAHHIGTGALDPAGDPD